MVYNDSMTLPTGLTFDDVLIVPRYSEVLPSEVRLETKLVRGISLSVPLLSAAMDTVTEAKLAIALAQVGGMGVVHKNMPVEAQAEQVRQVKKFESGVIRNPVTVKPTVSIGELRRMAREHNISGVPVVDDSGKLAGIVTKRDLRFETDMASPVSKVMTPAERLVTIAEGSTTDEVIALMRQHRIEKVPMVDQNGRLSGLTTVKDIQKALEHPDACRDEAERLRVGAAVGTSAGSQERVQALADAGADVIVVDTAHGHSKGVLEMVRWVRSNFSNMALVGGNVATPEGAKALAKAGADAVKVGIGPGSICTTRMVSGVGVPQISAIMDVSESLAGSEVTIIADGGIRYSGDIAKALAAGAHSVMIGGLLAGTDEAPGETELFQGRVYKSYRGMGSLAAMAGAHGSADRYFQEGGESDKMIPEGIEGRVPYKGGVNSVLTQLTGGLRSAMGYAGCDTVDKLRSDTSFTRLTQAGVRESHVHDVTMTKEPPNYRVD